MIACLEAVPAGRFCAEIAKTAAGGGVRYELVVCYAWSSAFARTSVRRVPGGLLPGRDPALGAMRVGV